MSKKPPPIIGSFGKGIEGSISINFGVSGGSDCDTLCKHHPKSAAKDATKLCYAVRSETRPDRTQLAAKLKRHQEMPPALVLGKTLLEIQQIVNRGKRIPWVRISTNGALPIPEKVRFNKLFRNQLRALLSYCASKGIPVHIPTESFGKARFYRSIVKDLAVVRESIQGGLKRLKTATGAVSYVAGDQGMTRLERVDAARSAAKARRESTGRKTVVCPAILNSWAARRDKSKLNARAKCGACVACAARDVDIVYPLH
jgi:hypothetical protein